MFQLTSFDRLVLARPKDAARAHASGCSGQGVRRRSNNQPSGRFALDLLDAGCGQIVDRDPARLYGVRNLSNQLDLQQAVVKPCSLDLDVGGQSELPLERPRRDTLIEEFPLSVIGLATLDGKHVLLGCYRDVVRGETGQRQRNPIPVAGQAFYVAGWVVRVASSVPSRVDQV
jgi:hypothetical protein